MKYVCDVCGWEYDEEKGYPEGGSAPGTKWEDIPEAVSYTHLDVYKRQGINKIDLLGEPLPGRRFKGKIWMMGTAHFA